MVFTDLAFFIFLPIVFIMHWLLPHKYRWALLLIASCYFYMSWNAKYIVLIMFTTVVSYLCGLFLERAESKRQKQLCLVVCLIACLGVLFTFKYLNWFFALLTRIGGKIGIPLSDTALSLILPVGISFYTFQTLSYVIDVYRERIPAEKHFGIYATFVTFFPQLVAGPIERTDSLLPQIRGERSFDYEQGAYGMVLMSWGFYKKVMIADMLAKYSDSIFNSIGSMRGGVLIFGMVCFTIQIYCDFSGYSDIAIGTAKLFGVNLCRNFHSPYFAKSIKEFWGRWHISLSTWFRDYVYIPCGGNRCSALKQCRNLMITFLLSGLWHGAGLHFVAWGLLHGGLQCVERLTDPLLKKRESTIYSIISTLFVFCFCNIAWVFFRAESVSAGFWMIFHMFDGASDCQQYLMDAMKQSGLNGVYGLIDLLIVVFPLAVFDYINLRRDCIAALRSKSCVVRWGIYICMTVPWILSLVESFAGNAPSSFIYFQF